MPNYPHLIEITTLENFCFPSYMVMPGVNWEDLIDEEKRAMEGTKFEEKRKAEKAAERMKQAEEAAKNRTPKPNIPGYTKWVINGNYGGYSVPLNIAVKIDVNINDDSEDTRTNKVFADWVDTHEEITDLKTVYVPDNRTDMQIFDYDGWESIKVVVDGKIVDVETLDVNAKKINTF